MKRLRQVRKRDGRLVSFDRAKIAEAIFRAAQSVGGEDRFLSEQLAGVVTARLEQRLGEGGAAKVPTIEDVQDVVERVLIDAGHASTAKAYILYRQQRAEARAQRGLGGAGAGPEGAAAPPLVGGDRALEEVGRPAAGLERWSKAALADVLVAREGLARGEAEEVARAVEARLLRSAAPRVSEELLDALTRAELFERGWTARALRPRAVGVPPSQVQAALERGLPDRRALDPAALAEGLGEAIVAQHVLDRYLPPSAGEAHRAGDLHVYDLGAPLRLSSVALLLPAAAAALLRGEGVSRAGGARRAGAAVEEIALRHAPHVARCLALEATNVWLAPFLAHLDEDALAEEVRQLLLAPTLLALNRRGGLLQVELGLTAAVPERLRRLEVPAPAPPGRCYGDYGETALHVTRAFLHEALELRRQGHWVDAALTLVLPRGGERDAARRALVRQALRAAGEGGEPVVVFDDPGAPTRGSRWFRLRDSEHPDPMRFERGDVTAAGAVALNLVGAALRTRAAGLDDFLREVDRLVRLALDVAVGQRRLLEGPAETPGGALYALRRGIHPLVDLESAFHLVEVVGADQAAALMLPGSESLERIGMRERIVRHVHQRVREEGLARRLCAAVAEGLAGEAAARFAALDAARFPEISGWWPMGGDEGYASRGGGAGLRREPLHPDRLSGGPSLLRVRHRVGADAHPPVDDLVTALEAAEDDAAVVEYAVDPWPRRRVRGESES